MKTTKYTKNKRLTWDNLSIPKNRNSNSLTSFNNHLNSLIDKIDFGLRKGKRKSHKMINTFLGNTENKYSAGNITLRKTKKSYCSKHLKIHDQYTFSLEEHLDKDCPDNIYYTSKGDSYIHLIMLDIDRTDVEATDEQLDSDVVSIVRQLDKCYGTNYYNRGSSGRSLHYFLKINSEPLYWYYLEHQSSIDKTWAKFMGDVYNAISRLLRLVYNPDFPSTFKFCGIKGTPSDYEYHDYKGKRYYTAILSSGSFGRLPDPSTADDYNLFYSMSCLSILSLIDYPTSHPLSHSLDKDISFLRTITDTPAPVPVPAPTPAPPVVPPPLPTTPTLYQCLYNGTFENISDISQETRVLIRSRRYLYYCYMKHILENGKEPTKDEYVQEYRIDAGTGAENSDDRIRLEGTYDKYIDQMRKYATGTLKQQIEKMESRIELTHDRINNLSTYNRTLYRREVAIAAVWIELCLTNQDYIGKKEWFSIGKGEHYSRELTVPMTALENFIEAMKEKGLTKNGCRDNHKKARALRLMLTDMGWIKCVDKTVAPTGAKGRARRYILLPDHPNYQQFKNVVGQDRIDYWLNLAEKRKTG